MKINLAQNYPSNFWRTHHIDWDSLHVVEHTFLNNIYSYFFNPLSLLSVASAVKREYNILLDFPTKRSLIEIRHILENIKGINFYLKNYNSSAWFKVSTLDKEIDKLKRIQKKEAVLLIENFYKNPKVHLKQKKIVRVPNDPTNTIAYKAISAINEHVSKTIATGLSLGYRLASVPVSLVSSVSTLGQYKAKFGNDENPNDYIHPISENTALVLIPTSDHNGAFEISYPFKINLIRLSKNFTVRIARISSIWEMQDKINTVGSKEKIGALIVCGHGNPSSIAFDNWSMSGYLTTDNISKISSCFRKLYAANVILLSCSTGKKNGKKPNIAQVFASELRAHNLYQKRKFMVFAPNEDAYIQQFILSDQYPLSAVFIDSENHFLHATDAGENIASALDNDRRDITTRIVR